MTRTRWDKYCGKTLEEKASPMLVELLERVDFGRARKLALDLGCGSGRDTRELLRRGWRVTAVDISSRGLSLLGASLSSEEKARASLVRSRFEDLEIPERRFLLVNAWFTLPFCEAGTFPEFWERVARGIRPGGVFAGNFFGPRDTWAKERKISVQTRGSIARLFRGFEVLQLGEVERDAPGRASKLKHWHIFNVLAQRSAGPSPGSRRRPSAGKSAS